MRLTGQAPNLEFFSRTLIGIPRLVVDENLNDSDKLFIVPNNVQWVIQSIWVEYISTSGADRQLEIQILDQTDDIIAVVRAGSVQGASITRNYLFAPGLSDFTAFRDTDLLQTPLPGGWVLLGGWAVRVFDNNAVDAAADDMTIQMLVLEMDTVVPDALSRRDFGTEVPVEQLTITSVKPIIEIKPVIPVLQLKITTVKPSVGPFRNVGTAELVITLTAPTMAWGINPDEIDMAITPTAPTAVVDTGIAPPAAQLTITPTAPTFVEDFPHTIPAIQLNIELHTPFVATS